MGDGTGFMSIIIIISLDMDGKQGNSPFASGCDRQAQSKNDEAIQRFCDF